MTPKISHKKPWFWFIVKMFLPIDWESTMLVFGDTCYMKRETTPDFKVHEFRHVEQQRFSRFWGTIWWIKYIASKQFRYEQEREAYREQWKFIQKINKDRNILARVSVELSKQLSGPMYGNLVHYETAHIAITGYNHYGN